MYPIKNSSSFSYSVSYRKKEKKKGEKTKREDKLNENEMKEKTERLIIFQHTLTRNCNRIRLDSEMSF